MPRNQDHHSWGYTRTFERDHGNTHAERVTISRDSRIRGGVYYGKYGGEAIVVNPDSKAKPQYDALMAQVKADMSRRRRGSSDMAAVRAVFDAVTRTMPYSQAGVDRVLAGIAQKQGKSEFEDGQKVDLSMFLGNRVGVCRHQALACGIALETLIDEGDLTGQVSVDRNVRWRPNGDADGHAWARYTTEEGQVYVLDVAQHFMGTLEESTGRGGWNYLRPEEQLAVGARGLGALSVRGSQS